MEPLNKKKQDLDLVTLFKGVAIFMVIVVHTAQPFNLKGWLGTLTHMALLGCQIFFVLSAFTLCLSFERQPQTYIAFIKRRVLRLIPGYWITILVTQVVSYLTIVVLKQDFIGVSHNPLDICINLLFLNGLAPTAANNLVVRGGWFVGTIVLLYLLFPLLYKCFNSEITWWQKRRALWFPLLTLISGILVLLTIQWIFPHFYDEHRGFLYNSFINQLPCFSLGFILFDLFKNKKKIKFLLQKSLFFLAVAASLFACSWTYNWLFYPAAFSLAFVYGYLFFQTRTLRLTNCLSKLFIALGKVNFGIYLIHAFFAYEMVGIYMRMCQSVFPTIPSVVLFLVILPVVTFLSWLFGKWYERFFGWIDFHTLKRIFK